MKKKTAPELPELKPDDASGPMTTGRRQAAMRARHAKAGLTEVRGIYAKTSLHPEIKSYARSLSTPEKAKKIPRKENLGTV